MPQSLHERIEPKLIYSPFLRLLIFNFWFQLGFAAMVLTLIAGALYLPKMWRVTPADFAPVVRISALDMTQDWALKRSARRLQAKGDYVAAAEAWQGAIGQNPGDVSALRGYMENFIHVERPETRFVTATISQMQWMLRLNKTNSADVELLARVCDKFAWYDIAAYFLGPLDSAKLSDTAQAVLVKSYFQEGRIPEFSESLEKFATRLKDPEIEVYRVAYKAGWGEEPESSEAFQTLERLASTGDAPERAGHLLLRAAAQKNKVDLYARNLEQLQRRNQAGADDQALYWTMLAASGRTNEAMKLAQSSTLSPQSAPELIRVAQSYVTLGLLDNARDMLKRLAPQFGRLPELWVLYYSVLQMKQDWDEMRTAARLIRQDITVRETLWGFSYFMEGRAELAQKREAAAKEAFDKVAESTFESPNVGALVARDLTRLNFPRQALRLYQALEPKFENNLAFWDGYYAAAFAAQDSPAILKSTERAYKLAPKDFTRLNNYSAALLLTQSRPEEAIQLTLQLMARYPESKTAMINHSCALLMNRRADEARALLEKIDAATLSSVELAPYYLALFETYHSLKLWDQAKKARESIVEGALFPSQRERLHQKEKDLPQRLAKTV